MKILIFTPYYYPNIVGGAEISTQIIAEGFSEIGDDIQVLTVGNEKSVGFLNGVKVITIKLNILSKIWEKVLKSQKLSFKEKILSNKYCLFVNKRLYNYYMNFIKEENFDLVLINSNIDCLGRASIWKAVSDCDKPLILTFRDPLLLYKKIFGLRFDPLYRFIIKRQFKWISFIAAPSKYMINLYKSYGFTKNQSKIICNAVDIDMHLCQFNNKRKMILYAGSICEKKGVLTLVKVYENLIAHDVILELIGRGDLTDNINEKQNILIKNWMERNELYKEMSAAKVVVLPSEYPEAFGRVIIEAIACGTLAIGSNAGGIPEIFDGDERYIFKAGNEKDLFDKMNRIILLPEREYLDELTNLQIKFEKYGKQYYVNQWKKYFEEIIISKNS